MRRLMWFLCLVVSFFVSAGAARADLISISIATTYVSGSLDGQSFAGRTLTYTATLTTAQYEACRSDPACFTPPHPMELDEGRNGEYHIASGAYLDSVTVGVSGLGVFRLTAPVTLNVFDYNSNVFLEFAVPGGTLGAPGDQKYGPDGTYDLNQDAQGGGTPFFFCEPSCSVATSAGTLAFQDTNQGFLTSSSESTITVTPEATAVTPEPGTWVMVGTGLVGGVGAVRRRLSSLYGK